MEKQQKKPMTRRQKALLIFGILAMLAGGAILTVMFGKRVAWRFRKAKLMRENPVIEIPELDIAAPILEGVGQDALREAAGHFPGTGAVGSGNYCIAAHSSAIYKEYFNALRDVENGMKIYLREPGQDAVIYEIAECKIVEPNETWVLKDFDDDRVTLVTCTDDGTQRRIIVGKLKTDEPQEG